jgi:hypothetical protein
MIKLIILLLGMRSETCLSTEFGFPGDKYGGRTDTVLWKRPVRPGDMGIAHRRWPMGSWVVVENLRTGLSVIAQVADRGPYGKLDPKGAWFNGARDRDRVGEWRGCADLMPDVVDAIDHNGKDRVKLTRLGFRNGTRSNRNHRR